jgi:hypothetical protein
MLYREITPVCSETHTKHIKTLCGQNVELLNVKAGGTYSDHWALKPNVCPILAVRRFVRHGRAATSAVLSTVKSRIVVCAAILSTLLAQICSEVLS